MVESRNIYVEKACSIPHGPGGPGLLAWHVRQSKPRYRVTNEWPVVWCEEKAVQFVEGQQDSL